MLPHRMHTRNSERNHATLIPSGGDGRAAIGRDSFFTILSGLGGTFEIVPTTKFDTDGRQVFRVTNPDFESVRIAYSPSQLADEILKANAQRPLYAAAYGSLPDMAALDARHEAKAQETVLLLRSLSPERPP